MTRGKRDCLHRLARLQRAGLLAQILDLVRGCRPCGVAGQALLTGFEKLFRPAIIQVLDNPLTATQLGDAVLAAQPRQHDADLLLRRKLPPRRAPDLLHNLLCRFFNRTGFLPHLRSFQWLRWARNPCNLPSRRPDIGDSAVAGERPKNLWAGEPARECVSSPAVPSNPNSRLGRGSSPFAQDRKSTRLNSSHLG